MGEGGADPNDIDVLLIGDLDRSAVYAAASLATGEPNRETSFRAISRATWDRSDDLFVSTIRQGPLVEIPLEGSG